MKNTLTEPGLQLMLSGDLQWRILSGLTPVEAEPARPRRRAELIALAQRHSHPFRELNLVLEGDAYVVLSDTVYLCHPGTILLADSLQPHHLAPCEHSHAAVVFRISLRGGYVFTKSWTLRSGEIDVPSVEDILLPEGLGRELDAVWSELQAQSGPSVLIRRAKLVHSIGMLLTGIVTAQMPGQRRTDIPQNDMLTLVGDLLRHDLGQGTRIEALATLAGYSPRHFRRLFQEHYGLTVHKYIDRHRIAAAKDCIQNGLSPKEVAARVGFASLSAFYHWWAKRIGGTPVATTRARGSRASQRRTALHGCVDSPPWGSSRSIGCEVRPSGRSPA